MLIPEPPTEWKDTIPRCGLFKCTTFLTLHLPQDPQGFLNPSPARLPQDLYCTFSYTPARFSFLRINRIPTPPSLGIFKANDVNLHDCSAIPRVNNFKGKSTRKIHRVIFHMPQSTQWEVVPKIFSINWSKALSQREAYCLSYADDTAVFLLNVWQTA